MTFFKWLAAAALLGSATACVDNNTPYGGSYGYGYAPGGYDYNQQPTYYSNRQQAYYGSQQPAYYGSHYTNGQPTYYSGYQQPVYYGR